MPVSTQEKGTVIFLENEMRKSYLDYAMSVIVGRALPDVRDGLKPVQRRIMYAMQGLNLTHSRPHRKAARLVGEVLGKYHPHGDMAVYDALVRMAQDFSLRYPLVDGQGNFGSVDGDPAAAMRYTEVRLQAISQELLQDLDKETVDFIPNFDNSLQEPTVLPAQLPNLLVNGASGIAVGMATNIPPHNLGEVVDACLAFIDKPHISSEELAQFMRGPDFPTGGLIVGVEGLSDAYNTGKGKITVRGRASIERSESTEAIIIDELPYQVNKAKLIERIAGLAQRDRIKGIRSIRDESDRHGIRIVVEVSRVFTSEIILNQLYKHTPLQTTFGIIMLALCDGKPRQLSLADAIGHYLRFRQEVTVRRTKYLLDKEEKKAHILEGLRVALLNLDRVIEIIRQASNPGEAHTHLIDEFEFSDAQAKSILNMRLQRITNTERESVEQDHAEALQNIAEFKGILQSETKVWQLIKEELQRVKDQYANPRRTQIIAEQLDLTEFSPEDLIEKEDIIVTLTANGYIKHTPWRSYKRQKRGGRGMSSIDLRKGDQTQDVFFCNTHSTLLFFTESGRVHAAKAYEIPQRRRGERGRAIVNFLQLREDPIITVIPIDDFGEHRFLLTITRQGVAKKTALSSYASVRRGGIRAIRLRESDALVRVLLTSGDDDVVVVTREGMSTRFAETDMRPLGRVSTGVKAMTLSPSDAVVDAVLVDETADLLTVTTQGYGKRTPFSRHRRIRRGGKGVKAIRLRKGRGRVVAAKQVREDEELLLLTKKGKSVRVQAGNIPRTGRIASGCRIINVHGQDQLIGIA